MTEDTGWVTPASGEAPALGLPDPHIDKDSPAATGVDVDELEARRDAQYEELRNLVLQQNETISSLRQQINGQAAPQAPGRKIPEQDHGGCTQCSFLSLDDTPNGETKDGTPTPLPAAETALQHLVFALSHSADTGHSVYAKFADRVFQLTR